jgi:hypothetical protein
MKIDPAFRQGGDRDGGSRGIGRAIVELFAAKAAT